MSADTAPILDHLEELRWRVLKSLFAVICFAVPGFIFWEKILSLLFLVSKPAGADFSIIYTAPADPVVLSIQIAICTGIACAFPILFYQCWKFIAPGLYKNEKRGVLFISITSLLLFAGGLFSTILLFPMVLTFLNSYAGDSVKILYRVQEYILFILKLAVSFGVIFEMPLLSFILTKAGLITAGLMVKYSRYSLIVIAVTAALLTPPDLISQIVISLPLLILYGISIVVSFLASPRRKTKSQCEPL